MEREYLRTRGAMILQRYYDSKNHQKRLIGTGRSEISFSVSSCQIKFGLLENLFCTTIKWNAQSNLNPHSSTVSKSWRSVSDSALTFRWAPASTLMGRPFCPQSWSSTCCKRHAMPLRDATGWGCSALFSRRGGGGVLMKSFGEK